MINFYVVQDEKNQIFTLSVFMRQVCSFRIFTSLYVFPNKFRIPMRKKLLSWRYFLALTILYYRPGTILYWLGIKANLTIFPVLISDQKSFGFLTLFYIISKYFRDEFGSFQFYAKVCLKYSRRPLLQKDQTLFAKHLIICDGAMLEPLCHVTKHWLTSINM